MMGIIIDIFLILQFAILVDSFVSTSTYYNHINKHQISYRNHIGPLYAKNKTLIVVGSTDEALAAQVAM